MPSTALRRASSSPCATTLFIATSMSPFDATDRQRQMTASLARSTAMASLWDSRSRRRPGQGTQQSEKRGSARHCSSLPLFLKPRCSTADGAFLHALERIFQRFHLGRGTLKNEMQTASFSAALRTQSIGNISSSANVISRSALIRHLSMKSAASTLFRVAMLLLSASDQLTIESRSGRY